jgi:hypothetical protein
VEADSAACQPHSPAPESIAASTTHFSPYIPAGAAPWLASIPLTINDGAAQGGLKDG